MLYQKVEQSQHIYNISIRDIIKSWAIKANIFIINPKGFIIKSWKKRYIENLIKLKNYVELDHM